MNKSVKAGVEFVSRAVQANRIFAAKQSCVAEEHSNVASGVEERDGRRCVVLRNVRGVMAVYRIRNDNDRLRRLKRIPSFVKG